MLTENVNFSLLLPDVLFHYYDQTFVEVGVRALSIYTLERVYMSVFIQIFPCSPTTLPEALTLDRCAANCIEIVTRQG